MTDHPELSATHLLITDLGEHTYRLTFGNRRSYAAIIATGSQLERWTAEIRAAIGAPPRQWHPYGAGQHMHGSGVERA